jgi:hypothetical protein
MPSFAKAVACTSALKAIGHTYVYLDRSAPDLPWDSAQKYEPGGLHRFDCCVSGWFSLQVDGVHIQWSLDLENDDANGAGSFRFNIDLVRRVMAQVSGAARSELIKHLRDCAKKIRAKGDEYQMAATRQYFDAASLESLTSEAA